MLQRDVLKMSCACQCRLTQFISVQFYVCSHKSQQQPPQCALYCTKNPNNQTTPNEKALGDSGEEKLPFNRKNLWQNQAAICHDQLGVRGGRLILICNVWAICLC